MWDETLHEVSRRLGIRVPKGVLSEATAARFQEDAVRVKDQCVTEVPEQFHDGLEEESFARLPRDAEDWQVVALALALGADILTEDKDFFGCGVATWTMKTLIAQLEHRER